MPSTLWSYLRLTIACVMISLFSFSPQNLAAQTHVVSPADLHNATAAATQARQAHESTLNEFFSSAVAQKALTDAQLDATQVRAGIATLSDQELARLAPRADKAQKDFAAGSISDHLLVLMVIAIAVVVIIIVAVKV